MTDFTLDEASGLTAGASMWTTVAIPAAGVDSLRMADGPMGVAGSRVDERDVSILTPAPVCLGASWDVALVERVGSLVGGEARRLSIQLMLAPNVNLARSPLAGRAFEYFSEDPLLTGVLGAAWITGLQRRGVGAVVKHLVCNDSETDRDTVNAVVDNRTLREIYLRPFQLAAKAGCAGMLTAYNRINGVPCSEAGDVIQTIVKQEWSYPGLLVSDWFGTHSTVGCLNGGLDLEMPGPARFLGPKAAQAVLAGQVDRSRVDDAAARVVAAAARFANADDAGSDEPSEPLLEEAAAAGFTLVRNQNNFLPLDPKRIRRLAVIGPNAAAPCFQGGTFAKIAVRPDAATPLQAIETRFGDACEVVHAVGVSPESRLPRITAMPGRDLGDGAAVGLTVDYYDTAELDAAPVLSEIRDTNSLTWFFGVHEAGAFQQAARTTASGVFCPTATGRHTIFIGGTGTTRLLVNGEEKLFQAEVVAPGDVMGRLKSGDADTVEIDFVAGQQVRLAFELRYNAARVQGLWFGVRGPESKQEMLADAVDLARTSDAVVLIVGETSDASVESKDRQGTAIAEGQIRLIREICAANPSTVVVANVGHAFDTEWEDVAAALLIAWYPGEMFGSALAKVLAGDMEPGGRMPVSIARTDSDYPAFDLRPAQNGDLAYTEGVLVGYRGLAARGHVPRHAIGSGFGYARFELSDCQIEMLDEGLSVTAQLRNVGSRSGAEVVQVYRIDEDLVLAGFTKTALAPGEVCRIRVKIDDATFCTWEDRWVRETSGVRLGVGRSSDDLPFVLEVPST